MDYKTLYSKVEKILEMYEGSRNDDMLLFELLITKFYPKLIRKGKIKTANEIRYEKAIFIKDIYSLPRQSDIERIRRKIQNDEKRYIPTSWEVAEMRKWRKEEWLKDLGYRVENKEQIVMNL